MTHQERNARFITGTAGLAFVAVLVAGATLAASIADTPSVEARAFRERGLQLGYDLDHQDALHAFSQAIEKDPADIAAYRLAAATAWIELLFDQGAITVDDYLGQARANLSRPAPTSALATAFRHAIDRALTLSEERLRLHADDADAHYQIGATLGCLASYTATIEGRVLSSLGPARRAYREHERTLRLDPRRKDAGLTVGVYEYVVANLSAPLRLMARAAGFGANREHAVRLVEDAARYPGDTQPNALFILILIYNREARYDDAMGVIHELQQRFPRNRLLWLEAGNTALRAGRPADAKAAIEHGLALLAHDPRPRASGEDSRWEYAHGAAMAALHDRAGAERAWRAALDHATRDWLRGRSHRELGKLADLSNDRTSAIAEYQQAERLCRQDHDDDCADEAGALIKRHAR